MLKLVKLSSDLAPRVAVAVNSGPSSLSDLLDVLRISRSQLETICIEFGNSSRLAEITPAGSGALVDNAILAEGSVTARLFLGWWIAEDDFERLRQFMMIEFGANRVQLLERSSSQSCRYRIGKPEDPDRALADSDCLVNPLAEIFAKIEARKESLRVQEYSVAQTTLEQIFNQFAGNSENPEVELSQNHRDPHVLGTREDSETKV